MIFYLFIYFLQGGISIRKYHVSVYFLRRITPLSYSFQGKNTMFSGKKYRLSRWYKKNHVPAQSFLKRPYFQNIWSKYHISVYFFFLRNTIFNFSSGSNIIFSEKKIFPDNCNQEICRITIFKYLFCIKHFSPLKLH